MTIADLASKSCILCRGTKPLSKDMAESRLRELSGWTLSNGLIEKEFRFKSYRDGLDFAYAISRIAEEQDHHPDILIRWRRAGQTEVSRNQGAPPKTVSLLRIAYSDTSWWISLTRSK